MSSLSGKVKSLPSLPGVYMFLDEEGRIIYIGKAINIKKRVATYFHRGRARDARMLLMLNEIKDINCITTYSEAEAFIYEAGLIKDHRPRFNIELKDDKSYPYLKLTENEELPRLYITRRKLNDGAVYYGPYTDVKLLKEAVSFMKKVFPLRTCGHLLKKVCLEYHLGHCGGPCEKRISTEDYWRIVNQLKSFLEGKKNDLIKGLEKDMKKFSDERKYERALEVKTRIQALTLVRDIRFGSNLPAFGELDELKNLFDMSKTPKLIECFDISNFSGSQSVGSMVSFVDAKPDKKGYRKFKIKTVEGIDDYSMIREVVRRRYMRLLRENKNMPDLIIIDGGKGHLFSATDELRKLGLDAITVASIAKEFNNIYTKGRKNPLRLSPGSRALHIIQRVRDEAHRFAITYHRKLRDSLK